MCQKEEDRFSPDTPTVYDLTSSTLKIGRHSRHDLLWIGVHRKIHTHFRAEQNTCMCWVVILTTICLLMFLVFETAQTLYNVVEF